MDSENFILPLSNPVSPPGCLELPPPLINGAFEENESRQPYRNTHMDSTNNGFDAYPSPDRQLRHRKKKLPWFSPYRFLFCWALATDDPEDNIHPMPPSCDEYPYHEQYHSFYNSNLPHSESAQSDSSDSSPWSFKIKNPWILSLTIPVILLVMIRGPWLLEGNVGVLFIALFLGLMYNILFGVCLADARRFAAIRECFKYACEPGSTFRFMDVMQMAVFFTFGLYVLAALNSGGREYVHY